MIEILKIITNGYIHGLPVSHARVYIGTENGAVVKLNSIANKDGEVLIETDDFIDPENKIVLRVRKFDGELMMKPFECSAGEALSVFTDENRFGLRRGTIHLERE